MAAISGHIPSLRRQLKNVACNYSDAQVKVREATSNDPWGASSSLMSEIADLTYNAMAFTEIMQILWKRLNDHGKNWRHVYKSLVLLDYLIKVGSEKVANQCRENIFAIQTLKDFQHIEDNKDQGMNVREKAKQLVALLKDDERLKNERTKALMARKRFTQNGSSGSGGRRGMESCRSDNDLPSYYAAHSLSHERSFNMNRPIAKSSADISSNNFCRDSELEECRPSSAGEEELQLQIALALSKEEAEKEKETLKGDDMRLQLALHESEKADDKLVAGQAMNAALAAPGQSTSAKNTSALEDLLSLEQSAASADPWGLSHQQQQPVDPWGNSFATQNISSIQGIPADSPNIAKKDPWSSSSGGDSSFGAEQCSKSLISEQTAQGDPWGGDLLSPMTASDQQQTQSDLMANNVSVASMDQTTLYSRTLKTPETFLGENSSLVNLDNLLSVGMKSNITGMQSKSAFAASTNPFAGSSAFPSSTLSAVVSPNNAFGMQQKRATPTLNEMRNIPSNQSTWGEQAVNGASSTNPFL